MDETGPRDATGRPLSRQEIDLLVREVVRRERDLERPGRGLAPTTPTPATQEHPSSLRRPVAVVLLVALLVTVATKVHGRGAGEPLPDRPTTYADGSHAFMRMQPLDPALPVGYDPCLQIPVVINYAFGSADVRDRVEAAIGEINQVSGLRLAYAGPTRLRRVDAGTSHSIVVSFADPSTDPALNTGFAAVGGSASYTEGNLGETQYYTGGAVTLNTTYFNTASSRVQVAILLHELGHALGLAHVTATKEIMNPSVAGTYQYQHGDLTGLAALGRLPCP